jgi:hypothetical protein
MQSLGNLILLITTLGAAIGLSLKYPVAGVPILMLLIYYLLLNQMF